MPTRYIVIAFGPTNIAAERLRQHPGVEVYSVDASTGDIEDQIDMMLLNDLHSPVEIVFVGGGQVARTLAERYHVAWTDESEDVNEVVLRLWGLSGRKDRRSSRGVGAGDLKVTRSE